MNYVAACALWNKNRPGQYLVPKKGTPEYLEIRQLMSEKNSGEGILTSYIPEKYNPLVLEFIKKYENWLITELIIARKPIEEGHLDLLNLISLGNVKKNKDSMNYDQLYHLSLEFRLVPPNANETIFCRVEKNHVIQINVLEKIGSGLLDPLKNLVKAGKKRLQKLIVDASQTDQKILTHMPVVLKEPIPFGLFLEKGYKRVGPAIWFKYDGLKMNCQHFVSNCLRANDLMNPTILAFVQQNAENLIRGSEFLKPVIDGITDISAILDHIIYS